MKSSVWRTNIPENMTALKKIPFCFYRKYRPEYPEADPLLILTGKLVDLHPDPEYWCWTPEQVADWIVETLNRPELRDVFIKNKIDGRSLALLEADKFPKMNVTKFEVIKEATKAIREFCKTDKEEFRRSISLPLRRPQTLYLWYKGKHSGPTAYYMTPFKFFKKINIIRDETTEERRYFSLLNHWNRVPPYRPWCPHVLIGANRRINPMTGTLRRDRYRPKIPFIPKKLCVNHIPR